MEDCQLLIDGVWRGGSAGRTLDVLDPVSEEVLYKVAVAEKEDSAEALKASERALGEWRRVSAWERASKLDEIARLFSKYQDEMSETVAREVGKPLAQARGEVGLNADQFTWYAGEIRRLAGARVPSRVGGYFETLYEPVGVVAALTPWNFPSMLVSRKVAPALAAGCAVIVSPSEMTPKSAALIVKVCEEVGLPKGTVQLLTGRPEDVSAPLLASPIVRKITFTGSTVVGKLLMRESAATLKRLTLELGGHAPVIVDNTVDVKKAALLCATGKYRNCGQVCVSPSRFYVHEDKYDEFLGYFVSYAKGLKLGDPMDPSTDMGPLIAEKRRDAVEVLVKTTLDEGGKLECGGKRPSDINRGFFFEPTVFTELDDKATIMNEEPFGPLAPIVRFRDREDVLARANQTGHGLASFVFSNDVGFTDYFKRGLQSGMVGVNTLSLGSLVEAPFGGINDSGFGEEGGPMALYSFLSQRTSHVTNL